MTSSNQVGTAWARDVERYLLRQGFTGAERLAVKHPDRGDIGGLLEWTIECKAMTRDTLAESVDQVRRAQVTTSTPWCVVLKKRKQHQVERGFAVMEIGQWSRVAALLDRVSVAERSA